MIDTSQIKAQVRTVFTVGAKENPKEVILIVGSCRAIACLNYLNRYNEMAGRPFRIHYIDPFNYHWDERNEVTDMEAAIRRCETDPSVLEVLRSTTIYIHEFYTYYGMFNSSPVAEKNIYQFGLAPRQDICLPNFHDRFVLFQEQVQFDAITHAMAKADDGNLSDVTIERMRSHGLMALEKFYEICRMSSFPEMAQEFRETWMDTRYFWTGNHVSRHFTLYLLEEMNKRFLHLPLDDAFWEGAETEDLFARPCTPVTQYDIDAYGLTWPDPVEPLRIP